MSVRQEEHSSLKYCIHIRHLTEASQSWEWRRSKGDGQSVFLEGESWAGLEGGVVLWLVEGVW